MSTKPLTDLRPHERCFVRLCDVQSELLDAYDPDDVLAALIAAGEAAKATVMNDHRLPVAELATDLLQRFARAIAVLQAEPEGQA